MARSGVLVLATGGPTTLDDVAGFVASVNEGGAATVEESALMRALLSIGGRSPLLLRSERAAAALERALNGLEPAPPLDDEAESLLPLAGMNSGRAQEPVAIPVQVGFAAADPSIPEAVARLRAAGVERVVVVPLSPLEAQLRRAVAASEALEAAAGQGMEVVSAPDFSGAEGLIHVVADGAGLAIQEVAPQAPRSLVVFAAPAQAPGTAGAAASLGGEAVAARLAAALDLGAPDPDGLQEALGVHAFGGPGGVRPWLVAYVPEPGWPADPAELSVVGAVEAARAAGMDGVVVVPFGYAVDDIATLYGLDVLAADAALSADMEYGRAPVPNEDKHFIEAMAEAVRAVL